MTNRQLDLCISEIASGSRESLRQLYEELKNPVFMFALSIVKNTVIAEDAEQETFLRVMQSAATYRKGTNPKAWIFGIARNCCIDSLKALAKDIPLETEALADIPAEENLFNKADNRAIALEALGCLKEEEQLIVSLYLYAGLKQTEIAKLLQIPYLSVRSKYGYALKKLRRCLVEKGVCLNE